MPDGSDEQMSKWEGSEWEWRWVRFYLRATFKVEESTVGSPKPKQNGVGLRIDDGGLAMKLTSVSICCGVSTRATLLREDWDQHEATEKLQLSLLQLVEFINQFRRSSSCALVSSSSQRLMASLCMPIDANAKSRLSAMQSQLVSLERDLRSVRVPSCVRCSMVLIMR